MSSAWHSLEDLIRGSTRALVIGVGGGGDVVGALATARFLEFCGLECRLGGLSWERWVFDPLPGPRSLNEVKNVRAIHPYVWFTNAESQSTAGVYFAESRMAAFCGQEVLLIDVGGGALGTMEGLEYAIKELRIDLLVGLDVGGDSLAEGHEPGLRSPLADSVMLAAFAALEERGHRTVWGVFGYGSDGELSVDEIERALSRVAGYGGLLGAWALTPRVATELTEAIKVVPTEASAIPVECWRGAWGEKKIRTDQRSVKLTPLTSLTFFLATTTLYSKLSRPALAVSRSSSLEEANDALHRLGLKTELDLEREKLSAPKDP